MDNEIRVIVIDDHPLLRQGLLHVIESSPGLKVVAEAADGEAALARIEELEPDIAVLDMDIPKINGLDVAREIGKRKLPVDIVFLTIHGESDLFDAAMDTGAKGYLLKEIALTEIVRALRAVAEGKLYVTPSLTGHLIRRSRQSRAFAEQAPGLARLTSAERHILSLISLDKSSKEIAAELFIHYRTVENHRTSICQKLGLHGHNALFKFALHHKSEL